MSDHEPVLNGSQFYDLPSYDQVVKLLGAGVCKRLGIYPIPDDLMLSVVIPVYNECHTLHLILEKVRAVPIPKQIILVDDCSKDGTRELLQRMRETDKDLTIAFHEVNQGKGAALRISQADRADSGRTGRCGVWVAVYWRNAPGSELLALDGKSVSDVAFEHVYRPEPDGHGGLL